MPRTNREAAVMLWGVEPEAYERGSLLSRGNFTYTGMHGFYSEKTGLFVPAPAVAVLGLAAVRKCKVVHLGDGEDTSVSFTGITSVDMEDGLPTLETINTLETHTTYQANLEYPARYDGVLEDARVERILRNLYGSIHTAVNPNHAEVDISHLDQEVVGA